MGLPRSNGPAVNPEGRPYGRYFVRYPRIPDGGQAYPSVSVCIPTRNRMRTIEACLTSIRQQDYPNLQLIVVDNESTDGTGSVAARYADITLSSPGPLGRVRQTSIDAASGEILAIIDDDIVFPHSRWLADAVQLFRAGSHVSTVWPQLVAPTTAGTLTRCFFLLNDAIFADRMWHGRGVFGGGNSLFARSAVEEVGGFPLDVDFGEDMVLAAKLKSTGYTVVYCEDPLIHDTMYGAREILRKQWWGARAVRHSGWSLLQQSRSAMVREQYLVGARACIRGLAVEHETDWLAYPALLIIKSAAYGVSAVANAWDAIRQRMP